MMMMMITEAAAGNAKSRAITCRHGKSKMAVAAAAAAASAADSTATNSPPLTFKPIYNNTSITCEKLMHPSKIYPLPPFNSE